MKYKPHTTELEMPNGDKIKLTQYLHPKYNNGHYAYCIVNKNDDIIYANCSTCSPPDKASKTQVRKIYDSFSRDRASYI